MRNHIALAIAVVLSGCGMGGTWRPDTTAWTPCTVEGFKTARAEDSAACPALVIAVEESRATAVGSGVFTDAQWHQLAHDVDLYNARDNFVVPQVGLNGGWTDCVLRFVEVGNTGFTLLHEMFHLNDCARDDGLTTGMHYGWDAQGYFGLSDVYKLQLRGAPTPTVEGSCKVSRPTAKQHANLVAAGFDMATYDAAADAADATNCKGK